MATKKITLKTIKQLIKEGTAIDLAEVYKKHLKDGKYPRKSEFTIIGISHGTAGMNGALLIRKGKLYGITSNGSALYYYV